MFAGYQMSLKASNELASQFYALVDGEQVGPCDRDDFARRFAAGQIDLTTPIWCPGMSDWVEAGRAAAFAETFPNLMQPPPLPSQAPAGKTSLAAALAAPAVASLMQALAPEQARHGQQPSPSPKTTARPASAVAAALPNESFFEIDLPLIGAKQKISMADVRDPKENVYLAIIWLMNGIVGLVLLGLVAVEPTFIAVLAAYALIFLFFAWVGWKLLIATLLGHSLEVGRNQYPQIYSVIHQASEFLEIPTPQVFVIQGHGLFELFVAKRFSRNGIIILTSNLVEEFSKKPSSREFMMFVGRQLGHIKAGHFRFWFFKNVIGLAALFFHTAWRRHCHITADRIGLLCAGNLYAAEQALLMVTVGTGLAPGTNFDAVQQQREKLATSFWAWLQKIFSTYPYMVVRLVKLREFATTLGMRSIKPEASTAIGGLPIAHTSLRSMPVLVIHGHDRVALLELQNLLYAKFPNVVPRVMLSEQFGALGMSEKFERVTGDLVGAIALVTPDDRGTAARSGPELTSARARQNVVMEIGWVWGRLGREKCLLLKRGDIELPSDLAGVDVQTFNQSPSECLVAVHSFIEHLVAKGSS